MSFQDENLDGNVTLPLHPMGLKWAGLGRVSLFPALGFAAEVRDPNIKEGSLGDAVLLG